ncbi:hypothetical protein AGMMS50239_12550 [Bacteroidia bacterium]|nr:hypothetical protein AGMMS50239_12550 [Bacteroidia bacterium]
MKKTFISIAVLATVGFAAFNVNFGAKRNDLSALSLANAEALAGGSEFDLPGNFNPFTNGSCTITLPNGTKRHGTWHDCNAGNTLCIQGCVAN